jgi:hypothetical protein
MCRLLSTFEAGRADIHHVAAQQQRYDKRMKGL